MKAYHIIILALVWAALLLIHWHYEEAALLRHVSAAMVVKDDLDYPRYCDLARRAGSRNPTWPPLPQRALTADEIRYGYKEEGR